VRRRASLRGGAYTAEGPIAIGAALADAPEEVVASLARFALPFGQAFQIRDDLEDGDATALGADEIERLVDQGIEALAFLPSDVRDALVDIARAAVMP
jgi:geranylgeranyl diphosphate synthase type I